MKTILSFLTLILVLPNLHSQNNVLQLDGVNDYVNLGNTAGNNIRTIEFWFKPATNINSSLSTYKTMLGRNTGPLGAGDHFEFGIFFSNLSQNKGKIAFSINDDQSNNYTIYSNSNQWSSSQWYHIAAVLDGNSGTKMFIDGILQNQTSTYTGSTDTSSFYTAIGRYGDFSRYFDGKIDNVKFHSTPAYSTNFNPSCNNNLIGDLGTWNFNSNSLSIAIDSSTNNNDGTLMNGTLKTNDKICPVTVSLVEKFEQKQLDVLLYPNPAKNYVTLAFNSNIVLSHQFQLINSIGQTVKVGTVTPSNQKIDLDDVKDGIYFIRIWNAEIPVGTYKLIKE